MSRALLLLLLLAAPSLAARSPVCRADRAQPMLGRAALPEYAAEALRLSRARELRWVVPGAMQTMEYKADRLNLEINSNSVIVRITCG